VHCAKPEGQDRQLHLGVLDWTGTGGALFRGVCIFQRRLILLFLGSDNNYNYKREMGT
jgi:hypothetical protein